MLRKIAWSIAGLAIPVFTVGKILRMVFFLDGETGLYESDNLWGLLLIGGILAVGILLFLLCRLDRSQEGEFSSSSAPVPAVFGMLAGAAVLIDAVSGLFDLTWRHRFGDGRTAPAQCGGIAGRNFRGSLPHRLECVFVGKRNAAGAVSADRSDSACLGIFVSCHAVHPVYGRIYPGEQLLPDSSVHPAGAVPVCTKQLFLPGWRWRGTAENGSIWSSGSGVWNCFQSSGIDLPHSGTAL